MTEERLAQIRAKIAYRERIHTATNAPSESPWHQLATECAELLAEVERLRAENAALRIRHRQSGPDK